MNELIEKYPFLELFLNIDKETIKGLINNDLNFSESSILFLLVWCFIIDYGENVKSDEEADSLSLNLCNQISFFKFNDLKNDFHYILNDSNKILTDRYNKLFENK